MLRRFPAVLCLAVSLIASSLHADVITTVGGPNVFTQGQSNALVSIFIRGNVTGQELGLATMRFDVFDSSSAAASNAIQTPILNNGEAYFGNGTGNPNGTVYFGRQDIDLGGNSRLVSNAAASKIEFTYAYNQGPTFSTIPTSDVRFADLPINSNLPVGTYTVQGFALDIDNGTGGYYASNGSTTYPTQFVNGSFTIQAVVVPEPNALVLMLAGSVFLVRRRTARHSA